MVIIAHSIQNYQVEIKARDHLWMADEPLEARGDDSGPNPYELLLGALAACKIITVQMYAQRKKWPLTGIKIQLTNRRIHARDCDDCESQPNTLIDLIEGEISFEGDLTSEQLSRLHEISNRCPVHRTLLSETKIAVDIPHPAG